MQTTLLSGSIKLSSTGHTELIEPREQLTASGTDSWQRRRIEQPDAVIAWTTGHFHFVHASLPEVLRQLERWYDIKAEMRIHGDLSQYSLNSVIDRTQTLSSILPNLSYGNDIKFLLQGKKLIVIR
jgi:ferric-dicitrate binding protein FerR (iron transport regulator)